MQYPDVDFYNSDFLRNVKQSHKAAVEVGGGNRIASYYFLLGYDYDKSLQKLGEAADEGDNTFRARGNVDVKITDYLRAKVDMTVVLNSNYASKGDFWSMVHAASQPVCVPDSGRPRCAGGYGFGGGGSPAEVAHRRQIFGCRRSRLYDQRLRR